MPINKELEHLSFEAKADENVESPEIVFEEIPKSRAAAAVEIDTGEVVGQLLSVTFELLAARFGDHWRLAPEEVQQGGSAYGAVIDKYFPDAGDYMGVELTAVFITGAIFMPRLVMNKKIEPAAGGEELAEVPSSNIHDQVNAAVSANKEDK